MSVFVIRCVAITGRLSSRVRCVVDVLSSRVHCHRKMGYRREVRCRRMVRCRRLCVVVEGVLPSQDSLPSLGTVPSQGALPLWVCCRHMLRYG